MAYIQLPSSGGGTGAVDSVNGLTGVVVLTKSSIGLGNVNNTSDANKPVSTATQTALNAKQDSITANNNQLLRQVSAGVMDGAPGLYTNDGGLSSTALREPDADGYQYIHYALLNSEPLQDSPSALYDLHFNQINLDNASSGFSQGVGGTVARIHNNFISHTGTGDSGEVVFASNSFTLGNGTDPIDVGGFSYNYGFGQVAANTTITGPMQGYGFQPAIDAASVINSASYTNAFYDSINIGAAQSWHTSFSATPTIASIQNNRNYTGINVNPNITTFTGNASTTGINNGGTFGTFGASGYYQGMSMNPSITSVPNYTGINLAPTIPTNTNATGMLIDMSNVVSSGYKVALQTNGDVNIGGSLSFSGALSIGDINAYYSESLVDGGGVPTSTHNLISAPFALANATIANADYIGTNTASLMTFGANSTITTNLVGIAALALPAVVQTHTGSSVDLVTGATFAISLDPGATGGTIDQVSLCRSVAVPNGITTVTKLIGYEFTLPFGDPGVTTWGIHITDAAQNYLEGSLAIGTSETVTNSSVGLEVNSVTKAVLLSRMTTTERDALTAVAGMVLFNTTTSKFQGYDGSLWADLN